MRIKIYLNTLCSSYINYSEIRHFDNLCVSITLLLQLVKVELNLKNVNTVELFNL